MASGNLPASTVSDYLKSASANSYFKPLPALPKTGDAKYSADQDASSQDFLSWLFDIVSRPEFAVTETASSIADAFDKKQNRSVVDNIFNIAGAPLRGLFSTAPEDKIYGAELMQKISDISNQDNPNYDPTKAFGSSGGADIAKGVVGLGLDIALDPLTYLTAGGSALAKLGLKGGKEAVAATRTAEEAKALNTLKEQGLIQGGNVKVPQEGYTGTSLMDSYRGTLTDQPKFSLTVYDNNGFKKDGFNYGSHAGNFSTPNDAIEAIRKIQSERGGNWVEDLGKQAVDARIANKDLPAGTSTYSINELLVPGAKAEKTAAIVAEPSLAGKIPVGIDAAANKAALRELIGLTTRPEGVASVRTSQKVIRDIQQGRKSTEALPTAPLDFGKFSEDTLKMVQESGFKVHRSGNTGLGAVEEKLAAAFKSESAAGRANREAIEENLASIRGQFKDLTDVEFEAMRKSAKAGKRVGKTDKQDAAIKATLRKYEQVNKQLHDLPIIGNLLTARKGLLEDLYNTYRTKFKDEGPVNILGNKVSADGALSPMDTFRQMAIEDSTLLKSVFGPKAFGMLKRMSHAEFGNPEKFNQAMDAIKQIFYKSGLLDDALVKVELGMSQKAKLQQEVLKHIGVNYDVFKERIAASKLAVAGNSPLGISEGVQAFTTRQYMGNAKELAIAYGIPGQDKAFITLATDIIPRALETLLKRDFDVEKIKDMYKYLTKYGIMRTKKKYGEGLGLDPVRFNTHKSWNLYKYINMEVTSMLKPRIINKELAAEKLADEKLKFTTAALQMAEDSLRNIGVPIHIDYAGNRYALGMGDIIEIIRNVDSKKDLLTATGAKAKWGGLGKTYMELLLFNATTPMAPTKLMDAIAIALNGGSKTEVRAMLQDTARRSGATGRIENGLAGKGKLGTAYRNVMAKKIENAQLVPGSSLSKTVGRGGGRLVEWNKTEVAKNLTDLIFAAKPEFEAAAIRNSEHFKQLVDADTMVITEHGMEILQAAANDPRKILDLILFANHPAEAAADMGATMGAASAAVAEAALKFETVIGEHGVTAANDAFSKAMAYRDFLRSVSEAKSPLGISKKYAEKMARIHEESYRNAAKDANDVIDVMKQKAARGELDVEDLENLKSLDVADTTKAYMSEVESKIGMQTLRSIYGGVARFFQNDYLLKNATVDVFNKIRSAAVLHSTLLARRVIGLRKLQKEFGHLVEGTDTPVLVKAFHDLQTLRGGNVPTNPEVKAAFDELSKHMSEFFDLTKGGENALLGNEFFRKGVGLDYINDVLKSYDILGKGHKSKYVDDLFDLERAVKDAKANNIDLLTAAAGQWREWEVKDPLDFISRLNAAAIHMATDVSVVNSLVREGLSKGFVSSVPVKGWVALKSSRDSRYVKILNSIHDGPLYVDPEVAQMIHRMEEIGRSGKGLTSKTGKVIQNYLDPVQNAWKVGITIYRPGHHVRNLIGDESMTYLAEGTKYWTQSASDAFKIMSAKASYDGVDMIRSLNTLGIDKLPTTGDLISSGKYGKFTSGGIYDALFSRGILPPTHVIEDLYKAEGTAGKFADFMRKASAQDTKFGDFAGGVSEWRDHYSRMKHFVQIIHKEQNAKVKRFASEKELFDYAAERVLKHHPDSSLLTMAEAKYARRVIPFYSWTRGAIPAVMSAALMHPGRATIFNKASYNLAIAMGVDPNSLADPFPQDQLFPSFLTEKTTGPQFKIDGNYYGFNPGIVTWDIGNLLAPALPGSQPTTVKSLATPLIGMTSPMFRIPLDLITGTQLATGSRINDYSDYIDSQIPGVNYLASISGYSPTGSIMSTIQGMGPDPMYQVSQGNRTPTSQALSALNYLSGLGISEFSKPNYINYAEIEKRNREAPRTRSAF